MPMSEFIEWKTYFNFEPFGALGEDRRIGTLTANFRNANYKDCNDTWRDVFPDPFVEVKEPDWREFKEWARQMHQLKGGTWTEGTGEALEEDGDSR